MIRICKECAIFKSINHRLPDQIRTITNNAWFSDLEILETHQQIHRQTHQPTSYTVTEKLNTGKPETPNQTLQYNDQYTANTKRQT